MIIDQVLLLKTSFNIRISISKDTMQFLMYNNKY